MAWVVVRNLDELRDQLNARFPKRDKKSDGSIGDTSHKASSSSHNPDKTGNPEYRDGDSRDEVRARDFDKDLGEAGVTMEMVVQHLVKLARAGRLPHLRYLIFNKRIWHKKDGYQTRNYTGSNTHSEHLHANSDFSQAADNATGVKYYLDEVGKKPAAPKPPAGKLAEDGKLGPATIRRWQQVMKTPVDGKISEKSSLVKAVQTRLKQTVDHRLVIDGDGDSLDFNVFRKTIAALQRYLKVPVDGKISTPVSVTVKALQRRLNENRF